MLHTLFLLQQAKQQLQQQGRGGAAKSLSAREKSGKHVIRIISVIKPISVSTEANSMMAAASTQSLQQSLDQWTGFPFASKMKGSSASFVLSDVTC